MASKSEIDDANRPLDKNLLRYVWHHTRAEQIWILLVILLSMPTYFMVLNLPVRIINEPIQGVGFENPGDTKAFLDFWLALPDFLGGASYQVFEGFQLERWPYLIALSMLFLSLVCINGLFKFYINTYKGRLGERMLRRMRYSLTDRVLRFPIPHFRRVKGSEVASMVKDEVEPFGEFIGDAFVQPAFLGGQALVAFVFILSKSFWLGMIAVAIIAVQVTLIPYLRRRVLELGRMRQLTARLLSGRIGEIVESINAIRTNDTSNYERAELSHRLGRIFFIRYELYQRKFFIKFLNNFLAQLTPFLFYVVGGYFAIRGTLNVGQLIGVINAYKDLPAPINGLIQWDQKRVDINIKYAQIVEQFNVPGTLDAALQADSDEPVKPITGDIQIANLGVVDESGSVLLEEADLTLPVSSISAAIGPLGSGAGTLASVIAGLYQPTSGRVIIDGMRVEEMPERIRGRRFAYVESDVFLPQQSLLQTMLYVTKHRPLRPPPEPVDRLHAREVAEAKASGNTLLDYHADWVDYEAMGVDGPEGVYPKIREVLAVVELEEMVYELAMRQRLDPETDEELCKQLIEIRKEFRKRIVDAGLDEYVEPFDWERYNAQATIAENLLFGTAADADLLSSASLAENDYLMGILREHGLDREFFEMGVELAETAIELFADLSPDNPFFEQLNFMTPEQLESYPPILARARERGFEGVSDHDRKMLIQLPFSYSEPRNRLKLLDDELQQRILKARYAFHQNMPEELAGKLNIYNIDIYNPLNTVQDNILYGRIAYGSSTAVEKIYAEMRALLTEKGLDDDIFKAGLDFDIGAGGKRLTENQRQRIVLARALLKGADLLIVNRGLAGTDHRVMERLLNKVLERARGESGTRPFGVFWVLTDVKLAPRFDSVFVFDRQKLVEKGTPDELSVDGTRYSQMVT